MCLRLFWYDIVIVKIRLTKRNLQMSVCSGDVPAAAPQECFKRMLGKCQKTPIFQKVSVVESFGVTLR